MEIEKVLGALGPVISKEASGGGIGWIRSQGRIGSSGRGREGIQNGGEILTDNKLQ